MRGPQSAHILINNAHKLKPDFRVESGLQHEINIAISKCACVLFSTYIYLDSLRFQITPGPESHHIYILDSDGPECTQFDHNTRPHNTNTHTDTRTCFCTIWSVVHVKITATISASGFRDQILSNIYAHCVFAHIDTTNSYVAAVAMETTKSERAREPTRGHSNYDFHTTTPILLLHGHRPGRFNDSQHATTAEKPTGPYVAPIIVSYICSHHRLDSCRRSVRRLRALCVSTAVS